MEEASTSVALQRGNARRAVRQKDIHRHAGGDGQKRREAQTEGRIEEARKRKAMALVVGRRPVFQLQVVGINGAVRERNLIVVGVVKRLRERVGGAELKATRVPLFDAQEQPVISS